MLLHLPSPQVASRPRCVHSICRPITPLPNACYLPGGAVVTLVMSNANDSGILRLIDLDRLDVNADSITALAAVRLPTLKLLNVAQNPRGTSRAASSSSYTW